MSNAKPTRPGLQPLSKMEVNIPVQVGEQIVKKADGNVVARLEFTTGTIRETGLFTKDHPNAQTLEQLEAAQSAPDTPSPTPVVDENQGEARKPTRKARKPRAGKGE